MAFNVEVNYGGYLVRDPILKYVGKDKTLLSNLDIDKWSYFELVGILKEDVKITGNFKLWWKGDDAGLKELVLDTDAFEAANFALSQNYPVKVFVQKLNDGVDGVSVVDLGNGIPEVEGIVPGIAEAEGVVAGTAEVEAVGNEVGEAHIENGTGSENDEIQTDNSESESDSDEDNGGIVFEDSEEERANAVDDGFDMEDEPLINLILRQKGQHVIDAGCSSGADFVAEGSDELSDGYETEELDSGGSEEDEDDLSKYVRFRKEELNRDFQFKIGMDFASTQEFKEAIIEHSILNGKEIKFRPNDKVRVRAKCKQGCGYEIFCSKVGRSSTYRIKTCKPKHCCGRVFKNKNANSKWVAKLAAEQLKSSNNVKLTQIMDDVRFKYGTGISMAVAWKARQIARGIVDGDAIRQYSYLQAYGDELKRVCKRNSYKLILERPQGLLLPRFGSFYMCLEGCKLAFKSACRPIIGLDGCHLKSKFGGQLLIAVGRDPNDQYLPLAFAVVESERKETWRWFLELLLKDIGQVETNRWIFISDQQKGLVPTLAEMGAGEENRFCLRHLYQNFKKKFGGGTLLRDLMMGAAKATYVQAWEDKMAQIKEMNQGAHDWLINTVGKKAWCKHAFSHYPKCDLLLNNLSEAFNSTILVAREKPIITLFEWIRSYLMARFVTQKDKLAKYRGDIMPKPMKRLDREIELSRNWTPQWSGFKKLEVTHAINGDKFIVNLIENSCSCNFWGIVGIPCRHAVAAIHYIGEKPENFVHEYYSRKFYDVCYSHEVSAINGQRMWENARNPKPVLPPEYKKGPGRPKKLRRREPNEQPNPTKLKKKTTAYQCRRCGKSGHNQRRCSLPPPVVEEPEDEENNGADTTVVSNQSQQAENEPAPQPENEPAPQPHEENNGTDNTVAVNLSQQPEIEPAPQPHEENNGAHNTVATNLSQQPQNEPALEQLESDVQANMGIQQNATHSRNGQVKKRKTGADSKTETVKKKAAAASKFDKCSTSKTVEANKDRPATSSKPTKSATPAGNAIYDNQKTVSAARKGNQKTKTPSVTATEKKPKGNQKEKERKLVTATAKKNAPAVKVLNEKTPSASNTEGPLTQMSSATGKSINKGKHKAELLQNDSETPSKKMKRCVTSTTSAQSVPPTIQSLKNKSEIPPGKSINEVIARKVSESTRLTEIILKLGIVKLGKSDAEAPLQEKTVSGNN